MPHTGTGNLTSLGQKAAYFCYLMRRPRVPRTQRRAEAIIDNGERQSNGECSGQVNLAADLEEVQ
jgi:hypothetical protein